MWALFLFCPNIRKVVYFVKYRVFWKIFQYSRPVHVSCVSKGALIRDHTLGVTECVRARLQPRTDKKVTDRSVADFKKIIQH